MPTCVPCNSLHPMQHTTAGAEGSGEVELGGTRMTASAAYTLMGAAFAMLALPCIFTPKLVRGLRVGG